MPLGLQSTIAKNPANKYKPRRACPPPPAVISYTYTCVRALQAYIHNHPHIRVFVKKKMDLGSQSGGEAVINN